MSNVIDFSKFTDCSKVRYMDPKNDRYTITRNIISTQIKKGLSIKTPLIKTYGIEDGERNKIHDGKFKVKLIFSTNDNPKIETFKQNIIKLDEKFIQDAIVGNWLGNNLSAETVTNRYCSIFDINGTKSAFIKANVPNINGNWDSLIIKDTNDIVIFPNKEGILPRDIVHNKSRIICNLNITQIWIKLDQSKWGVSVKLVETIVVNPVLQTVETECKPFGLSESDLADIEEMSH